MNRAVPIVECVAVLLVLGALHTGWSTGTIGGGFHPGHVWAVDHVAAMMSGTEAWSGWTQRIGAPEPVHLRLIGWAPLLVAAPLSGVMHTGAAMWVAMAAGYVLTARLTARLIGRVSGASPWTASAAGWVYTFSPFALGVLANGQLAKMQLWCLPWVLLIADRVLAGERPARQTALLMVAATVTGFTAPSVGLVAPIALGVWVLVRCPRSRAGALRGVVALAAVALGMAVPWLVHTVDIAGTAGLVPAAPVPGLNHPPALNPVATIASLTVATGPWDGIQSAINNVAGVGAVALLAGVAAAVSARRTALTGLGLAVAGMLFALGPSINAAGYKWVLPAQLMEWSGYPIVQSGMYYRFSQVACLGLALLLAHLAQTVPRRAVWIAAVVAGVNLAENIRETATLWPRMLRPIPHAELMRVMANDPAPGAVVELPLAHLDTEGERRLLGQLIHGRNTTVLARNMVVIGQPRLERLSRLVRQPTALRAAGFRYVLLHEPNRNRQQFERLTAVYGPSQGSRQLGMWVVP